jgi:predicted glycoside hydrolase/deacetylase ChbG (UPF0249 family)
MRQFILYLLLAMTVSPVLAQQEPAREGEIRLLVRADDMGAAQAVNEACIKSYKDGIVKSVEVIVPGPWFLDAVRLLKENPDLDVGVHLALTSEWERVKWRPLTNAPSLVDANGYFYPMTRQRPDFPPGTGFIDAKPKLEEVERELRAQIETAQRHLGKRVSHISSHMLAAAATPELKALTERLSKEYGLIMEDISLKFGECSATALLLATKEKRHWSTWSKSSSPDSGSFSNTRLLIRRRCATSDTKVMRTSPLIGMALHVRLRAPRLKKLSPCAKSN